MEVKSTLKVFNEEEVESTLGIGGEGQRIRVLAGSEQHPSERMIVITKSFDAGTYETLHWHLIEAFLLRHLGQGSDERYRREKLSSRPWKCDLRTAGNRRVPRMGNRGAAETARVSGDRRGGENYSVQC